MIRVSGPLSRSIIEALTGRPVPKSRHAALRCLTHGGAAIDRGLILYFKAPASFTGEDMAEFHVHGGPAVMLSLSRALTALGARLAEPGEFSKRAFLNGKIDLTEAEAIADLIDAESAAQQAQALAQAGGALSKLYEAWTTRLLRMLAYVEASLDFADEDLPPDMLDELGRQAKGLGEEIATHLADARRGERLRRGVQIAILGAPNAGKSSLLNTLAQRDVAIVSARAGTTRDVIEVHLDLAGYPVIVADTAGLREATDEIESEGIARAKAQANAADIKLLLFDATQEPDSIVRSLNDDNSLLVATKRDLPESRRVPCADVAISILTGEGVSELLAKMGQMVAERCGDLSRPAPTRERHAGHLRCAHESLVRYGATATPDLAAQELRVALRSLGRITGRVDVEDLLDVIFKDFCIGK